MALQVWLDVGSADERAGEAGACHFLEHMIFRGAGGDALAPALEALGADVQAATRVDLTSFQVLVPAEAWREALEILLHAVFHPDLAEAAMATERGVVLQEIAEHADDPEDQLLQAVLRAGLGGHAYARPITGTTEQVRGLRLPALAGFHSRWFRPERLVVVGVGPLATGELEHAVARHVTLEPGGARREPRAPAPQAGRQVSLLRGPNSPARVEFAWRGPQPMDPQLAALNLACSVLDDRLAQPNPRDGEPAFAEPDLAVWLPREGGLIELFASRRASRVLQSVERAVAIAGQLRRRLVDRTEFDGARARLLSEWRRDDEQPDGRAERLAESVLLHGDADGDTRWAEAIARADPRALRSAARRFFDPRGLVVGAVAETTRGLTQATLEQAVQRGIVRAERPTSQGRCRPVQHRRHLVGGRGASVAERVDDRGARLLAERIPGGLFAARIALPGGHLAEQAATHGRLTLLGKRLVARTKGFDEAQVQRLQDRFGGWLEWSMRPSSMGLRLCSLAEHAGSALALFADALRGPRLLRGELDAERRDLRAELRGEGAEPHAASEQAVQQRLFPGHPWSLAASASKAGLKACDRPVVESAWPELFDGRRAVVAVAGDVDPDAALDAIQEALQHLPEADAPAPPPRPAPPEPSHHRLTLNTELAWWTAGWRLPPRRPDAPPIGHLVATLLESQSGPLFGALRDDRGLVYDLQVCGFDEPEGGWIGVQFGTEPRRMAEARDVAREVLARLARQPLDSRLLRGAKRTILAAEAEGLSSVESRAQARCLDELCGAGWRAAESFGARLAPLDAEVLRAWIEQTLPPDGAVEVSVRPRRRR